MLRKPYHELLTLLTVTFLIIALACGAAISPSSAPAATPAEPVHSPTPLTRSHITHPTPSAKQYDAPPSMVIDPSKKYTAVIELEKGRQIVIELFANEAPMTVNNFVFLARDGFYDGLTFHRVLPDLTAIAGDPAGTGKGGPGYWIDHEFSPNLRHDVPGVVSMANSGIRGGQATNGSQFQITFTALPELDGLKPDGSPKNCASPGKSCHTVFGRVIEGMDVVNNIRKRSPQPWEEPGDAIKTITVQESE